MTQGQQKKVLLPEIKDMTNSPQLLNMHDRAFWVLGWNECRDAAKNMEARIAELEAELVEESARTAEQKLRADQISKQHDMQCAMHKEAVERAMRAESELEAVGAGGVGPLRKQAAQGIDMVNCKGGNWLTVVYRDIRPGDEARTIGEHPKVSALSWSHALNDRDAAIAAQAKQGECDA